jgi:hypothetical protein
MIYEVLQFCNEEKNTRLIHLEREIASISEVDGRSERAVRNICRDFAIAEIFSAPNLLGH